MNKYTTYFGQKITDDELNEIFASFSGAIEQFILDAGFRGIVVGAEISPLASISVVIGGPAVIYDQLGNRITWATPVTLPLNVDENNLSTAVGTPSYERWISIFAKFKSTPSDPREDELGNTVFFRTVAGYEIHVVSGPEAPVGTAARTPLRADSILLGDVKLIANQTAISAGDVDSSRAQTVFDIEGTPLSVKARTMLGALQTVVSGVNGIGVDSIMVPAMPGDDFSLPADTLKNSLARIVAQFSTLGLDGVAKLAVSNTFTQPNVFQALTSFGMVDFGDQLHMTTSDAERALLASSVIADPNVSGNKWRVALEFKVKGTAAGGQYVRMYVGGEGNAANSMLFCTNAKWDRDLQQWERRDPTLNATALIFSYTRVQIAIQDPAAGNTWSDWPVTNPANTPSTTPGLHTTSNAIVAGDIYAGGKISALGAASFGSAQISGTVNTGPLNVGGAMVAAGLATATGFKVSSTAIHGVTFNAPIVRSTPLSLAMGRAEANNPWNYAVLEDRWQSASPGRVAVPIIGLPAGAYVRKIYATHNKPAGGTTQFFLVHGSTQWGNHFNGEPAHADGVNTNQLIVDCIDGESPNGFYVQNQFPLRMIIQNVNFTFNASYPEVFPWVSEIKIEWSDPGVTSWVTF